MKSLNLSAIAIVDAKEQMIAELSTSDFKGLVDGNFKIIKGPLITYLQSLKKDPSKNVQILSMNHKIGPVVKDV